MTTYKVRFSAKAELGLKLIIENSDQYTIEDTFRYIRSIRYLCNGLKTMPYRYEERKINDTQYRSFTYKAHQIFYRVEETNNLVFVIAVLHGAQDWHQYLD